MQKVFVSLLIVVTLPLFAGSGKIEKKPRPVKNSYIVVLDDSFKPNAPALAALLTARHGGKVTSVWESALRGFAIQAPEPVAEAIARDPYVLVVEENQYGEYTCLGDCKNTQSSSRCADGTVPWQLDRIDQRALPLNGTYDYCIVGQGEGVRAYVVDSGIRLHDDFLDTNGNTRVAPGKTFIYDGRGTDDCFSHGTHVASFLAGRWSGPAKGATLVPVRVSGCTGEPNVETVTNAVNWIKDDHVSGPAVANISLIFADNYALNNAVNELVDDGVVVTVAAGNWNRSACSYSPQKAAKAITVGASTKTDAKASWSNFGSCVAIFAPGAAIGGAQWDSYYGYNCNPGWNGTSNAAPIVAGVAAVIYGQLNWMTPAQVKQEIIDKATVGVLSSIPTGTPNRLLYSREKSWCGDAGMCYSPPPCDPES